MTLLLPFSVLHIYTLLFTLLLSLIIFNSFHLLFITVCKQQRYLLHKRLWFLESVKLKEDTETQQRLLCKHGEEGIHV